MRKNEGDEVEEAFRGRDLDFIRVNAEEQFLAALKGVTDPEEKRKIIGAEFVKVFEEVRAKQLPDVKFLAQGTIYPDVIESGGSKAAVIKSHHNVGGLPEEHGVYRPCRASCAAMFKDEVRAHRAVSWVLQQLVSWTVSRSRDRGLGVRIIGEITAGEAGRFFREADAIFREEAVEAQKGSSADQYLAVLDRYALGGVWSATSAPTIIQWLCVPSALPIL